MLLDLKQDIREECEKLGVVTNVVLYDAEDDGVVSVKFANADSAKECIQVPPGFPQCPRFWVLTYCDMIDDERSLLCWPKG